MTPARPSVAGTEPEPPSVVGSPAVITERRRAKRQAVLTAGTLVATTDGLSSRPRRATVTNVSPDGVGLRLAERLSRGATFDVEIGTGPLYLRGHCRVVWTRRRPDGTYDAGCEFC